ncbi:MAG: DUF3857 domain-containing protein [Flavobacterium sp.]
MKINSLPFFILFFSLLGFGQKSEYSASSIPDSLKQNANAVVRLSKTDIDISSQKVMTIKSIHAMTILNELGLRNLDVSENYDKNRKIIQISATAYDAAGKEIKVYKRKDFRDISVADGSSIFNDNRALYLDYTPVSYPFTMVFETEIQTSNTAFIPSWSPVDNYLVSTENTSMAINFKPELNLKRKEVNFSGKFALDKKENSFFCQLFGKKPGCQKKRRIESGICRYLPGCLFCIGEF